MIRIHDRDVFIIRCYQATFDISRPNVRPVHCCDCHNPIGAGLGIHRRQFRHNGYLCFACFQSHITVSTYTLSGDGDNGFIIGSDGNLQACLTTPRKITTPEVIAAVLIYVLDLGYDATDAAIGEECADPFKIADIAESIVSIQ